MQPEGRVAGDDTVPSQAGSGQEAIDGPDPGVGVSGHGREDAPRDTPDVARLQMLGEHRGDGPVTGAAADGAAYSSRWKTGCALKKGAEMSRDMTDSGRFMQIDENHI